MILDYFCPPALLYVAFSTTHIIIDTIKGLYNTAMVKFLIMIVFCIVLNLLCSMGLSILSWFIVFIPFIMMTVVSSVLLFTFGLSPSSGKLNYNVEYPREHSHGHSGEHSHDHSHGTYYRNKNHPINYNLYPHSSYGHRINLDKNYYKNNIIVIKDKEGKLHRGRRVITGDDMHNGNNNGTASGKGKGKGQGRDNRGRGGGRGTDTN